jgi:hypothetical protein
MAENKKSFIMYADVIHVIEKLNDEQAGKLLKHIFRYVNDQNPIADDLIVDLVFEPIKRQMKRDLMGWEEKINYRSASGRLGGLKSGEVRRSKNEATKQNEAKRSNPSKNEANEAVTVNDTVNVTDTVNVKEKEKILTPDIIQLEFKNSFTWNEKIMKDYKIPWDELENWQDVFVKEIDKKEKYFDYKNLRDAKGHFISWLNLKIKEKNSAKKETYNGNKQSLNDLKNAAVNILRGNKTE